MCGCDRQSTGRRIRMNVPHARSMSVTKSATASDYINYIITTCSYDLMTVAFLNLAHDQVRSIYVVSYKFGMFLLSTSERSASV